MIREGIFDDSDIIMDWHPGDNTEANVQHAVMEEKDKDVVIVEGQGQHNQLFQ